MSHRTICQNCHAGIPTVSRKCPKCKRPVEPPASVNMPMRMPPTAAESREIAARTAQAKGGDREHNE